MKGLKQTSADYPARVAFALATAKAELAKAQHRVDTLTAALAKCHGVELPASA